MSLCWPVDTTVSARQSAPLVCKSARGVSRGDLIQRAEEINLPVSGVIVGVAWHVVFKHC